jgi:pyrroloquinoline-quinone synthase
MSVTHATFQSDAAYVARNKNVDVEIKLFLDQKIDHILQHRATEHPFLNAYAQHGLRLKTARCCI